MQTNLTLYMFNGEGNISTVDIKKLDWMTVPEVFRPTFQLSFAVTDADAAEGVRRRLGVCRVIAWGRLSLEFRISSFSSRTGQI